MKVLVLGLGTNGGGRAAALHFAHDTHTQVRVSDMAPRSSFGDVPDELERLGVQCHFAQSDPKDDIKWADVVIKNPAVPTSMPQLSLAKRIANDFSYLFSMDWIDRMHLVAVTGTKGKTTTVAAIQHGLQEMGSEALICGNIGISAFTVIEEIERRIADGRPLPQYIVTSKYADHQNSYHNLREYYDDKLKLFGPHCRMILVNSRNRDFLLDHTYGLKRLVHVFPGYGNPFRQTKMELQCAFVALRLLGFSKRQVATALSTYKGMPHRIEQVALYKDIMFVNDSAATIAEAVTFSMKNIAPLSTHLICGGTDKDLKATGMEEALTMATSITLLDGSFTRTRLLPLIESLGLEYEGPFSTMKEAFDVAVRKAEAKREEFNQVQCVLLSPGAASFELFRNEFDRGNQFKALVKTYVAKKSGQRRFPLSD